MRPWLGLLVIAKLCPSTGDSRARLSLSSGNSSDGESRKEGSEARGSHMEIGRQQQASSPNAFWAEEHWEQHKKGRGRGSTREAGQWSSVDFTRRACEVWKIHRNCKSSTRS